VDMWASQRTFRQSIGLVGSVLQTIETGELSIGIAPSACLLPSSTRRPSSVPLEDEDGGELRSYQIYSSSLPFSGADEIISGFLRLPFIGRNVTDTHVVNIVHCV